jgi:hypothetical protein
MRATPHISWPWPASTCEIAPELAGRFAAVERPLDAAVRLDAVDRVAAGLVAVDGLRDVAGFRADDGLPDAAAFVDARLVPFEDVEEEALGGFAPDAGDFCFVATGVRDSLVALSARRTQQYWSDQRDVGITAGFLLGSPDLR